MEIKQAGAVSDAEINVLRKAVALDFTQGAYDISLPKAYTYFTARENGELVGYVSIISDGVADAFLVDLIVHPGWQRKNIGKKLVHCAGKFVKSKGIQCLQVTFNPENEAFYKSCGFHIFKGGIMDFKTMPIVFD